MSLQALLGVVRHLVIERIGVDVNILLISQVALPYGDVETASGGTQQHQNASSEASSRYSHSIVARLHGVLLRVLSSIRCYLTSYRPNQF